MNTGDHMEIPQSENLISEPKTIESSLPSTSLVLPEISQDTDEASSEMEPCLPISPSVHLDIAGTKDEQSPKILESSLSTTSYVQMDTTEAQDEPNSGMEPPLEKNSKTNPFIEDLLKTYTNPNPSLEVIRELEKKVKELSAVVDEQLKGGDLIPSIGADDTEGAAKIVENLFQLSDAIDFLIKERLPETHPLRHRRGHLETAKLVIRRIDIYSQLFVHALNDAYSKRSGVPASKGKGIIGNPLQYYESTEFMVFLINKVLGEEDIMTTSLVPPESTDKSKTLIISCVDRYVKETLGICICLVLKELGREAKDLFRDIVKYIKSGDVILRGRVYNYALRKAEELFKVRRFLASKFPSQRYKNDVETRDLLNWIEMDQRDNQVKVHNFFVELFLDDEELMKKKDQLTFAWMERYDYPYLIKCVCECHQLLQRSSPVNVLKVCVKDGAPDNWKKVQLYVEYALHSCAMLSVVGVPIICKLFEIWPELDVNASYKGVTAFHVAAYKGHGKVVKILLDQKDFDVNVRTGRFITVESLKKVFERGEPELDARALSRGIISYEGGPTSACKDYEDVIKDLICHGEIGITFKESNSAELKTKSFFQRAAYSGKKWNRNRWKMSTHQTALHIATKQGHASIVKLLCEKTRQMIMRYHEEDEEERTVLDIVYEKLSTCQEDSEEHGSFSEIEKTLLSVEDVQKGIDRLYRYRQVLVDAANTILVGAALIAGVTFAGWLQPPLGYAQYYDLPTPLPAPPGTYDSFIGVQGNIGIQAFALFNSLSFFFAIATVIVGADAAFPMRKSEYIGEVINTMQRLLQRAIKFLIISLACVLGAFGSAAVVILPPHVYFRKHLVLTILIGGGVCGVALWQFLSRHSKKVQVLNAMIVWSIARYTFIFNIDEGNPVMYNFLRCCNFFQR